MAKPLADKYEEAKENKKRWTGRKSTSQFSLSAPSSLCEKKQSEKNKELPLILINFNLGSAIKQVTMKKRLSAAKDGKGAESSKRPHDS